MSYILLGGTIGGEVPCCPGLSRYVPACPRDIGGHLGNGRTLRGALASFLCSRLCALLCENSVFFCLSGLNGSKDHFDGRAGLGHRP